VVFSYEGSELVQDLKDIPRLYVIVLGEWSGWIVEWLKKSDGE
jgi:hypothetical protein